MTLGKLRHSLAVLGAMVAFVLSGTLASAQTVAQALDLVPADAELVVVIPNAKQSSEKVAAFCKKLGIESPKNQDLLGQLKNETHLATGLNESAPMVLAVKHLTRKMEAVANANPANPPTTNPDPVVMVLIALSDKTQFLANFQDVQELDGVSVGKTQTPDMKSVPFRLVDSYVLMAEHADQLANYQPAKQSAKLIASLGELGQPALAQGDLTVWANLETLGPKLIPLIDKAEAEMQKNLAAGAAQVNPSQMAIAKLVFSLYARAGRTIVRDAISAGFSLDLNPEQGVGLTYMANFKPDSQSAKLLGTGKASSALLNRLPAQPYIGAVAADLTGMDLTYLINEIKTAVPADSTDVMSKMLRSQLDLLAQHQSMAVAYYPASPKPGSMNLFTAVGLLQVSDAAKVRQGLAEYYQMMNDMPGATPGTKMYQGSYQPNATTIQGLGVDQYTLQMNMTPEMMNNPAMQFMNMLGITNQTGLVTSKSNQVIVTYGTDVNLLQSALTAMDRTDGLGQNAAMNQMRKQLPPNLIAEGYFSITGTLSGVAPMLMMFGMMPPATSSELPPVAFGLAAKNGAAAARMYVPMENITYVKNMIDQVQAQKQLQQAPGAPGMGGTGGMGGGNAPRRRPNQAPPAQPAPAPKQ